MQGGTWNADEQFQLRLNPSPMPNFKQEVWDGMWKISDKVTKDLITNSGNPILLNAALERRIGQLDDLRWKMDNKYPARMAETARMIEQEQNRIRNLKSPILGFQGQLASSVGFNAPPNGEATLVRAAGASLNAPPNRGATRSSSEPSIVTPIQRSRSEPLLTRAVTPEMIKLSTEYETRLAECEKQSKTLQLRCEPQRNMEIVSKGSVSLGSELGRGAFGVAYDVPSANAVIKVVRDPKYNLCREKVGLEILNGLGGLAPRIYKISSGVSQACSSRVIALEKLGDANWGNAVRLFDKNFYLRFARLIEVVRTLHEKGFIHHDLKGDNIRVKNADPNYVALIDFGILSSIVNLRQREYSLFFSRKTDAESLVNIAESIPKLNRDQLRPHWLHDFTTDMMGLGPNDRPPYEKWIDNFRQIARSMQ